MVQTRRSLWRVWLGLLAGADSCFTPCTAQSRPAGLWKEGKVDESLADLPFCRDRMSFCAGGLLESPPDEPDHQFACCKPPCPAASAALLCAALGSSHTLRRGPSYTVVSTDRASNTNAQELVQGAQGDHAALTLHQGKSLCMLLFSCLRELCQLPMTAMRRTRIYTMSGWCWRGWTGGANTRLVLFSRERRHQKSMGKKGH